MVRIRKHNTKRYKELEQKEKELEQQLKEVLEEKTELEADEIDITDHAICRYIERVKPELYKEVLKEILPFEVRKQIITLGGKGRFPVGTSHKVEIKNYTVVTVIT